MIVCIAEKPSVARDIADVLGAKIKKRRIHRRKRIPGYLDVWSFVHIKRAARIHSFLEIMELKQFTHDSASLWYKADQ